ncbi:hypothetical protein DPEC_G00342890 [Dallia pectoralis]|uniref:Uncharacterized protein n=1 Tax=Dallia pectoralis TaxID=75939 RepID=A0ACC2F5S7_DALPE|nr:hypothetical protein DPEC_G00342890 [Dallia pectoralis]
MDSVIDSVHHLGKREEAKHRQVIMQFTMRHYRDELWRLTKRSAVCKELNVSFAGHILPADREARAAVWPQIKQARAVVPNLFRVQYPQNGLSCLKYPHKRM